MLSLTITAGRILWSICESSMKLDTHVYHRCFSNDNKTDWFFNMILQTDDKRKCSYLFKIKMLIKTNKNNS